MSHLRRDVVLDNAKPWEQKITILRSCILGLKDFQSTNRIKAKTWQENVRIAEFPLRRQLLDFPLRPHVLL